MAKGQKTEYETLVLVMNDYFTTRSYTATANNLGMPKSTIKTLVDAHINDEEFVQLRTKKEAEFVERANHLIFKAMNRLNKELDSDKEIPVNQLTTAIGTLYDKKAMAQNGDITNDAPRLQINIVDHSDLEGALYDEKN